MSLGWFKERHRGFWYMRWPDFRDWIVLSPQLFAPKAPCDYVAVFRGRFFALELKSTRGQRFQFSWIKEHQKEHLLDITASGGKGYLLFSTRVRPIKMCAVPIEEYLYLEQTTLESGVRSVKTNTIMSLGIQIPRDGLPWNLKPLFEG